MQLETAWLAPADWRWLILVVVAIAQLMVVLDSTVVNITVLAGHRQPDWIMLAGIICCCTGIACFLAVAHPSGGGKTVSFAPVMPLAAALAAVLACCLAAAHWGPRSVRPLWLALACGVDFGVTAFLLKVVPDTLPEGCGDPLRQSRLVSSSRRCWRLSPRPIRWFNRNRPFLVEGDSG